MGLCYDDLILIIFQHPCLEFNLGELNLGKIFAFIQLFSPESFDPSIVCNDVIFF